MWDYNDKVIEYFLKPRNVGTIDHPDAEAEVGSIVCGDMLKLQLKVNDEGIIEDAKFKTFGCGSAIASASVLTEMVIGKTIEEAAKITNKDIVNTLGGLPAEKMHCSVMGMEALQTALANYKGEGAPKIEVDHSSIICRCFGITENKIRKVIKENKLRTVEEVTNYTKAGGGCGSCLNDIQDIMDDVWKKEGIAIKEPEKKEERKLTNIQKINLIQETIESELRPAFHKDGGDIELIDVIGDEVHVALRGTCTECPAAGYTLKGFVEHRLREFVSEDLTVKEVKE